MTICSKICICVGNKMRHIQNQKSSSFFAHTDDRSFEIARTVSTRSPYFSTFQILLYLSSMGEHKFFLDNAFMGGPLGELTQWCDLISALYVLGHDVTIGFKVDDVPR